MGLDLLALVLNAISGACFGVGSSIGDAAGPGPAPAFPLPLPPSEAREKDPFRPAERGDRVLYMFLCGWLRAGCDTDGLWDIASVKGFWDIDSRSICAVMESEFPIFPIVSQCCTSLGSSPHG